MTDSSEQTPHIAILGAGFSGTLLLYHLVRLSTTPLKISLIERTPPFACGLAYSTKEIKHLLNVRAGHMSAFDSDPDHFYRWVLTHEDKWRRQHPELSEFKPDRNAFFPRMIYGAYLNWIWQEALAIALDKHITIQMLQTEAREAVLTPDGKLRVTVDHLSIVVDALVLALGVPEKNFASEHPRILNHFWKEPSSLLFAKNWLTLSPDSCMVIIGSGLTLLDTLTTLQRHGYHGKIIVMSNEGKLPEEHLPNPLKTIRSPFNTLPTTALSLLKEVRAAVRGADDWRQAIDAFRLVARSSWKNLSLKEKRKLQPLFSLWNRHRHRMPPAYKEVVEALSSAKRLEFIAAKVVNLNPGVDKVTVVYKPKGSKEEKVIAADYVINCAGPESHIAKSSNPIIQDLFHNKFILPHGTGLGISLASDGSAEGVVEGKIFAVGQLLLGELFETTAVPELRKDCETTASKMLAAISAKKVSL